MKKRMIRWLSLLLLLIAAVVPVRAEQTDSAAGSTGGKTELHLADLNAPDIKLGLPLVSAADIAVAEQLPLAQVVHYKDVLLGYMDVASGRIDAFIYDEVQMKLSLEHGVQGVRMLENEYMDRKLKVCMGISPVSHIPDLEKQANTFLAELHENGTIDDMLRRWVWDAERTMSEIELPSDPTYHLVVGTSGIAMPFSYYEGEALTGMDIEMAYRFASWLGADLEFQIYDYDAIVPAALSGKVDIILANLQYTDERVESGLIFSEEIYEGRNAILVRDDTQAAAQGSTETGTAGKESGDAENTFWSRIASSFEKTFLRENRWKMFLEGVGTTLLITVLSLLFGTALGFLLFMLCRNGNPAANYITRFCSWLVLGTPMVVLLMILYYIILGSVDISGTVVAVMGFTLTFGASVLGLLKMGVGAVDPGQYEAAYALGHSSRQTFFEVILPQAIPVILPAFKGEIVGLIKATAVVGYIAVQDLTKMGDIVRSRTYEAFFPLIAVTVIYFLLEGLLGLLVSRLDIRFDPKRRSREQILKGVKTSDKD